MANLQKYFEQFHGTIRVDYDAQDTLREKRDIVLEKIDKHLRKSERPTFERVLQGSYKMKTGVFPSAGEEHDIDVGLAFTFESLPDVKDPRKWVLEAIQAHTDNVVEKTPCIRVHYKDSPAYHLDLVVYGVISENYYLATKTGWKSADPKGLLKYVEDAYAKFKGTESSTGIDQFRRVVRYLKRWGDVRLPGEAEGKPAGLAYTLLAASHLSRTCDWDGTPNDAEALLKLARQAQALSRIRSEKPTPEYEDMFRLLSDAQMTTLKTDFGKLADAIDAAQKEPEPSDACAILRPILGDDFPQPPQGSGGKKTSSPAIVPSSSSA